MAGGSGNQLLDTGLMIAAGVAAPELAPLLMEGGAAGLGLGATAATGVMGAGLSAGVAGLTGQDVGKAALMGGIGGAASGALGGVNAAEQGSMLAAGPTTTGAGLSTVPSAATTANAVNTGIQNTLSNSGELMSGLDLGNEAVTGAQKVAPSAIGGASNKALLIGGGSALGLSSLMQPPNVQMAPQPGVPEALKYSFDRNTYQPAVAPYYGGIASAYPQGPEAQRLQGYAGGGSIGTIADMIEEMKGQQNPVPETLRYTFDRNTYQPAVSPSYGSVAPSTSQGPAAQQLQGYADGGTVEQMSRENAIGGNQMFPQSGIGGLTGSNTYQNATNTPMGANVLEPTDAITDPYTGAMKFATGGIAHYDTGGRTFADATGTSSSPLYDPVMDEYKRETDFLDRMRNSNIVNPFHLATGGIAPTSGTQQNSSLSLPVVNQYMKIASTPTGMKQVNILAQQGDYNAQFALNKLQGNQVQGMDAESQMPVQAAQGGIMGYAGGGDLGSYSDGGRMLKGPGDGMSDSIPAKIGNHQPARLADSEFVIPADVVSHLGNGSSDAGAKQLYSMMDRVRKARTGRKEQGKEIKPQKYMPA